MKRPLNTVFIALGTNMGDRLENLDQAIAALPPEVQPIQVSSVYETPPWGFQDQPAFLNAVLKGETRLKPGPLLRYLKETEVRLGRKPSFQNGPRLIDLDVLFYNDRIVELPGLSIPHPRLHERAFVLVPLADLAPDLVHPRLLHTVREMLQAVDQSGVRLYDHKIRL